MKTPETNPDKNRTASLNDSWPGILTQYSARWKAACAAAKRGPKILITNAFGINPSVSHFDSIVAAALTLRGADVHILYCDQALPACWNAQWDLVSSVKEFTESGVPRSICEKCFSGTTSVFKTLGLPLHPFNELITAEDIERAKDLSSNLPYAAIEGYHLDGLSIGEHAFAGALRFLARGDLSEPHGEAILRRYLNAALQSVFAIRSLTTLFPFDCLVALHGMYVPEGLFCEVARQQQARVVNWMFNYRKRTCTLSHWDTYTRTLQDEPTKSWENIPWTPEMEANILDYLDSRRRGTRDWHRFIQNPQEDLAVIAQQIGVDLSKPFVVLLTNVVWDSRLFYPSNAFKSMMEWVLETITYFAKRADLQLIIRVHPAELLADTQARQTVISEIRRVFSRLPGNVFIIPPESRISTYSISSDCNAVLIYGTTAGIEMASRGLPVIVAGDACLRNKGIGLDAGSPEEYFQLLDRLPLNGRLTEATTQRALKYACHFFFRRMVPLPFTPTNPARASIRSLDELLPGAHPGLDVVCDGILHGSAFVYPAELHSLPEDADSPPDRAALARESFRVALKLGKIGEVDRSQACLLDTLKEFSFVIEKPWALSSISAIVLMLALASDRPISTMDHLRQEAKLLLRDSGLRRRILVRGAFGYAIHRLAIALWKQRSYRHALLALMQAVLCDPTHLIKDLPKLLLRMAFPASRGRQFEALH